MKQSAFPISGSQYRHTEGMTLRDYFAAKAIQGFLAYAAHKGIYAPPDDELASASYQLADAMMKARGE
jgi:hypothetical protein